MNNNEKIKDNNKTEPDKTVHFFIACILGWLFPGAGHIYMGKKKKGIIFCLIITSILFIGLALTNFRDFNITENPFYYIGRFGSGFVMFIISILSRFSFISLSAIKYFEIGAMYIACAGLLNLLTVISLTNCLSQKENNLTTQNYDKTDINANGENTVND